CSPQLRGRRGRVSTARLLAVRHEDHGPRSGGAGEVLYGQQQRVGYRGLRQELRLDGPDSRHGRLAVEGAERDLETRLARVRGYVAERPEREGRPFFQHGVYQVLQRAPGGGDTRLAAGKRLTHRPRSVEDHVHRALARGRRGHDSQGARTWRL